MPYPPNHRQEVRERIVRSARRLFNRHGFENVSVGRIMADAGLTHGGFYTYFDSKSDLYVEALSCFFTDPNWKNCWDGVQVDLKAADAGAQIVHAYLSRQHFEDIDNSCPMVTLPSDVAHSDDRAKEAYETVFQAMVGALEGSLAPQGGRDHTKAMAIAALCVGGMVVARSMRDPVLAEQLRDASLAVALQLGGWDKGAHKASRPTRTPSPTRKRAKLVTMPGIGLQ